MDTQARIQRAKAWTASALGLAIPDLPEELIFTTRPRSDAIWVTAQGHEDEDEFSERIPYYQTGVGLEGLSANGGILQTSDDTGQTVTTPIDPGTGKPPIPHKMDATISRLRLIMRLALRRKVINAELGLDARTGRSGPALVHDPDWSLLAHPVTLHSLVIRFGRRPTAADVKSIMEQVPSGIKGDYLVISMPDTAFGPGIIHLTDDRIDNADGTTIAGNFDIPDTVAQHLAGRPLGSVFHVKTGADPELARLVSAIPIDFVQTSPGLGYVALKLVPRVPLGPPPPGLDVSPYTDWLARHPAY